MGGNANYLWGYFQEIILPSFGQAILVSVSLFTQTIPQCSPWVIWIWCVPYAYIPSSEHPLRSPTLAHCSSFSFPLAPQLHVLENGKVLPSFHRGRCWALKPDLSALGSDRENSCFRTHLENFQCGFGFFLTWFYTWKKKKNHRENHPSFLFRQGCGHFRGDGRRAVSSPLPLGPQLFLLTAHWGPHSLTCA